MPVFIVTSIILRMTEKWWKNSNEINSSRVSYTIENALTISSLRSDWEILSGNGIGITIYKTPGGIFRAVELENGTLIRLERIECELEKIEN